MRYSTVQRLMLIRSFRIIKKVVQLLSQRFRGSQSRQSRWLKRRTKKVHKITLKVDDQLEINVPVVEKLACAVKYVFGARVDGDFVEFGTQTGLSATVLATALNINKLKYEGGRKIWFFDSFEGLPRSLNDIDASSPHVKSGLWGEGRCKGFDEITFSSLVGKVLPREDYRVFQGWFEDTVIHTLGNRFALIHVDCDLYSSTMSALHFLFNNGLVAEGAILLFDDWFCNMGNPFLGEQRAFKDLVERFQISYSTAGLYGPLSNSFIIHSYRSKSA